MSNPNQISPPSTALRADAKPFQPAFNVAPLSSSSKTNQEESTPPQSKREYVRSDEVEEVDASAPQHSAGSRGTRNSHGSNRGKKVVLPTEIFSFTYDRPSDTELLNASSFHNNNHNKKSSGKSRKGSSAALTRETPMTKSEFVQANFRFIVSPLVNPMEPAWYDPNSLVPWEMIECVIAPISQENTMVCPICLDLVHIPRITKCGHTYCMVCLMKHMKSDRSNRLKCPMCMEYIFQQDLKSVKFEEGVVVNHSDMPSEKPKLILNESYTFQHLVVYNGRISPFIYSPSLNEGDTSGPGKKGKKQNEVRRFSEQLQTLAKVIPEEQSQQANFAKIAFRNVSAIRSGYIFDKKQLMTLRQQAVQDGVSFEDESMMHTLSVIDDAIEYLTKEESKFESQLSEYMVDSIDYMSPPIPILENTIDPEKKQDHRINKKHKADTGSSSKKVRKDSSSVDLLSQLYPSVTEEEEIQLAIALMESMNTESVPVDKSSSAMHKASSSPGNDGLFTNLFQCSSGLPVYLHPLCTRCILEQAAMNPSSEGVVYPQQISGKVIDIDRVQLGGADSLHKSKCKFLKFLPKYMEAYVVEIEMKPLVSQKVLNAFKEDFAKRKAKRMEKLKQLDRERKQDEKARIKEEVLRQDRLAHYNELRRRERQNIIDISQGPSIAESFSNPCDGITNVEPPSEQVKVEDSTNQASQPKISFREITQMHGHFPTLTPSSKPISLSSTANPITTKTNAWGQRVPSSSVIEQTSNSTTEASSPQVTATKGNVKKTKVSLLSTTSSRSYR